MGCLVKIPHPICGNHEYPVDATSLFDAVRCALKIKEDRIGRRSDDSIVTVIENGMQAICHGFNEHNAKQRQWRVRSALV